MVSFNKYQNKKTNSNIDKNKQINWKITEENSNIKTTQ